MKQLCIFLVSLTLIACSGTRPVQLGSENKELSPCPDKPNCVISTVDQDNEHYIQPFSFTDAQAAHAKIVEIISNTEAAEIIVDTPSYIYAEYTSDLMKFVDDVEFLFDSQTNTIHIRSASRLGYKDFNVNRDRVETIRSQFK